MQGSDAQTNTLFRLSECYHAELRLKRKQRPSREARAPYDLSRSLLRPLSIPLHL